MVLKAFLVVKTWAGLNELNSCGWTSGVPAIRPMWALHWCIAEANQAASILNLRLCLADLGYPSVDFTTPVQINTTTQVLAQPSHLDDYDSFSGHGVFSRTHPGLTQSFGYSECQLLSRP